ncbi:MAG: PQQ-binding-like beta-propeller repeat protein [Bryobacterales bacterium]|nr:PQQ-binding-like beta-propeller repeat protein [Bryobacterales bacterium]MBV9400551.1 PQQ-binding-like beta-propeller repeat protein [Bryobacterales bacterium]
MRCRFFRFRAVLLIAAVPLLGQTGAKNGEWPAYGADLGNTHYSPLDQIDASNFSKLEVAWRFKTDNFGPRPETNLEATPLMVKGVVYTTAGTRRAAVAIDAATGEVLWMHSEDEGSRGANAPRQLSGRGLAYWTDGREERILYVTPGYRLIALNARNGRPIPGFGKAGVVDLKLDDDQEIDLETGEVGLHATPVVAGDTVIVGAAHRASGSPKVKHNVTGYVRGFDVRTGKRNWIFHTIPRIGEFGHDTWEKDSAENTGNAGVWGQISVDQDLGLAYLPVELPTGDIYGGHRPGNGLFGESIVAVDLKTGQRRWHYQLVHHGIWDFDIPCAPMLIDINLNGRVVKAVAQPTKQGVLYTFNRLTGQPIWPIEERPVPKGDVPGEWYSPTQPIPTKPPPYGRAAIPSIDDLIDFTPELRAEALKIVSKYQIGPIFTPIVVSKPEGPFGTILTTGVTNWPGGSYDPETHMLYVHASTGMISNGLVPGDPSKTEFAWVSGNAAPTGTAPPLRVEGLPLVKPPYASIVAIDMNKGEIRWSIPNAETPDNVRNHPALKGLNIARTGRQSNTIGILVTKTLMIAGEPGTFTLPDGRQGAMLRAYDKKTGQERGAVFMPAGQTGTPMTYQRNGRQYIVLAIGGQNFPGELIAFRLPES